MSSEMWDFLRVGTVHGLSYRDASYLYQAVVACRSEIPRLLKLRVWVQDRLQVRG